MDKDQLSKAFFSGCENIHDATNELYETLHPLGEPTTTLDVKLDTKLKKFMSSVRVEVEGLRESIKEFNNE